MADEKSVVALCNVTLDAPEVRGKREIMELLCQFECEGIWQKQQQQFEVVDFGGLE